MTNFQSISKSKIQIFDIKIFGFDLTLEIGNLKLTNKI